MKPVPTTPFVEVFTTTDFGEHAFIRSFLESAEIKTWAPHFNAERMGLWTSSFFRRFSVFVHEKDAPAARELLQQHDLNNQDKKPAREMVLFARVLLVLFLLSLILSAVLEIRAVLAKSV